MKTIKIGIDARMFSDNFTGIGRYTFELTERLFAKKLVLDSDRGSADFLIQWVVFMNAPEYHQFDFPSHVKKVLVNAKHYSLTEQTKFLMLLNREKCDLIHFTHFNVPLLYTGKYIVTIHDTTLSFYPGQNTPWFKKKLYRLVIANAIKKSAEIITVSKNTKTDVLKLFPVEDAKLTAIWNGLSDEFGPVSAEKAAAIKKKYQLAPKFLLYTGVWREHKNIEGLFQAFTQLQKKSADFFGSVDLVLTGSPKSELLALAAKLGISSSLKSVGKVPFEDLVALMSAAEVFVFPSLYEGFGLPPLEAMKTQTPVVASRVSAIPEICGTAAEYFNPTDINDMVEKIRGIFTDEKRQQDLIAKGLEQVKQFSWDTCADETWEVYEKVLGKKS